MSNAQAAGTISATPPLVLLYPSGATPTGTGFPHQNYILMSVPTSYMVRFGWSWGRGL